MSSEQQGDIGDVVGPGVATNGVGAGDSWVGAGVGPIVCILSLVGAGVAQWKQNSMRLIPTGAPTPTVIGCPAKRS